LLIIYLDVSTFNAAVTGCTERLVQLMIMSLTVRMIVVDIKIRGAKGFFACHTHKTPLVISTCESAVGRTDRFAYNDLVAASAKSFVD
jgi:hypothetical protein